MSESALELPPDLESLRALALRQRAELETQSQQLHDQTRRIDAQAEELRVLREYVRLLKHQRFGRTSEQAPAGQLALFNEAEASLEAAEREEEKEVTVGAHTRKRRGRRPLPEWIPRVEIRHDLEEAEKVCAEDGATLECIGEEKSEQLEFIPATLRVLRHIRPKYACPRCRTGVRTAPPPAQPIPKSVASPTLLAHVAVSKYADGLPLYRQERMFQRLGIDLPRATFASWMVKAGALVQPLVNLFRDELLASGFVQCDETRFQVLNEPDRPATRQSYLWVQRTGALDAAPVLLYDYDPSRGAEVPERLFEGFEGILQTDGYEGYGRIGRRPGIRHVGCWAHCRRKFVEALQAREKAVKKKRSLGETYAHQGLAFIQKLYAIERGIVEEPPEVRRQARLEDAKPVMEAMRSWLDASLGRVPPKSLTGKALAYADAQWPKLVRVLEDGRIPLDTNAVENAIRPFVVGRKGWLFADTVGGAEASANLYSLVETAKANGLEPFAYLRHVFAELPRATALADFEALLPWRLDRSRLQDPRRLPAVA